MVLGGWSISARVTDHELDKNNMHLTTWLVCIPCEVSMHEGCPPVRKRCVARSVKRAENSADRTACIAAHMHSYFSSRYDNEPLERDCPPEV